MTTKLSVETRNGMVGIRTDAARSGTITVYTGSQPSSADDSPTGSVLVTFTLDSTPFGLASGGSASLSDTPLEETASSDGEAGWYRLADSGGTAIEDGSCGESSGNFVLSTTTIVSGVQVTIQAGSLSQPAS